MPFIFFLLYYYKNPHRQSTSKTHGPHIFPSLNIPEHMGEKNKKGEGKDGGSNDNDNKKKDKGNGGGGGEKGDGKKKKEGIIVVLKMDMHCEGCADKILKHVKSIDGVEKAKTEWESNKLTVLGDVDPSKIREDLQKRTKKKVELVSPQLPSKDKKEKAEEGGGNKGGGDGGKKSEDKKGGSSEQKKPKEIPAITAVFKLNLHCGGCIKKIQKIVSKTRGVESVSFDGDKDLVMVTGRFDAGEMADVLADKMKLSVQVVPAKKNDKDKDKDNGKGGGEKKDDNKKGGPKVEEKADDYDDYDDYDDDDDEEDYGHGGRFMEGRRVEYGNGAGVFPAGLGYGGYPPGYGGYPPPAPAYYELLYGNTLHAPQMFSDENPNSCSIM